MANRLDFQIENNIYMATDGLVRTKTKGSRYLSR